MEDYRGKLVVIFAGYKDDMEKMFRTNKGLKSRINATIEFPNYTGKELLDICDYFVKKMKYEITQQTKERIIQIVELHRARKDFANAREVRNILEQVLEFQALRTANDNDNRKIVVEDVIEYQLENKIILSSDLCDA